MDTAEILKKVRKIEIKTRGISNQIFSGEYHSCFKGRGMSFSEVRAYEFGDDVRTIDWNVTARLSQPYIKVFEEERELTVMLLIDVSASSFFGTQRVLKNELMIEIAAVIAFSAINNNDKVGALFFSDKVIDYMPPKKGKSHILAFISRLIAQECTTDKTNISNALQYITNMQKKRTICFMLSDFIDKDYLKSVQICARKHDLIGVRIQDIREHTLENIGLIRVQDSETRQIKWLDTAHKKTQQHYTQQFMQFGKNFNNIFRKSGANTIEINTMDDYTKVLLKFFKSRK